MITKITVTVAEQAAKLAGYINELKGHPGCNVEFVKRNPGGIVYNAKFNDGIDIQFIEPNVVPVKMMCPAGMIFIVNMYNIIRNQKRCN